jgi:hypothetical protein
MQGASCTIAAPRVIHGLWLRGKKKRARAAMLLLLLLWYTTRSPLQDHTRIIGFTLKVPDAAWNS